MAEQSSPGYIESVGSSKRKTREDLSIENLIPSEILANIGDGGIKNLLKRYYEYMNMNEFIYTENETFTDIVINGQAQFRVPNTNENNEFFIDGTGSLSTLTSAAGNSLTLDDESITISNGNELPGSLANETNPIGKTLTITGLSAHNNTAVTFVTPIKYYVGPGPSYVLNSIEQAMDIDENSTNYLDLMQKEIAQAIPRNLTTDKRKLYKRIIDFYKVRGSQDSIEIFFRLLFDDDVEVEYPWDSTLRASAGNWSSDINQFVATTGMISEKKIRIHDSNRYQKYSYLIKTGQNVETWENVFNRLVHPAGFVFFGEILILLQLLRSANGDNTRSTTYTYNGQITTPNGLTAFRKGKAALDSVGSFGNAETDALETEEVGIDSVASTGGDIFQTIKAFARSNRITKSSMPGLQPGVIGVEDIPLLVEMFVSQFLPEAKAKVHKNAVLAIALNNGAVNNIEVVNKGYGYSSAPSVTISGTGSNASATAVINAEGEVESVTINNGGSGYTEASVAIAANSNAGKLSRINLTGIAPKTYRTPPNIVLGAPTAVDQDGNLLSSNVQAVANFVLEPTGVNEIEITNRGSGYTITPGIVIGDPTTFYTAPSFFTDDFENASINNDYTSWRIITPGHSEGASHTASIDSTVADTGSKSLKIQTNGGLDTNASGNIGGVVAELDLYSPEFTSRVFNNTVKVKVRAKKPSSGGASFFEMAYSTNQHGNSGWQRKTLTTDWADYEFEYNINNSLPTNTDYVGFQGDGSNGIVYIDNVSITIKKDRAEAFANIHDGKIDGVTVHHQGSGYTTVPTVTFTDGNATAKALLKASEISSINISNIGNGYVSDPRVTLGSSAVSEKRARDTIMYLITHVHNTLDRVNNNYFNKKGNSFYNGTKKFDSNQRIDLFSDHIIQNNYKTVINSYNTSSFIEID